MREAWPFASPGQIQRVGWGGKDGYVAFLEKQG